MKQTVIKIAVAIIVLLLAYAGWQVYRTYQEKQQFESEAAALQNEIETLKASHQLQGQQLQPYQAERVRCSEYVSQTAGDFSEFEYCQRYLELSQEE